MVRHADRYRQSDRGISVEHRQSEDKNDKIAAREGTTPRSI